MPRISSTTWPAGPSEEPEPSTSAPRSLMTSLAPWLANSRACSRPMPRPAPVMTTMRPSQIPMMFAPLLMVVDLMVVGCGRRSILVPQQPLVDLPRILARQPLHEVHGAWALEMGQVLPAEGQQLGLQLGRPGPIVQ